MKFCRSITFVSALFVAPALLAATPQDPINNLFDAMREHDGTKLQAQFMPDALLQRVNKTGEMQNNDISKFANIISESKNHLDEHLLGVTVQQSDNLASVWTPYAFYLDGKLRHCGVNSFQLVLVEDKWKIQYLIDNVHQGDCEAFIQQHSQSQH
ncbi:hypothetical protein [Neptunicella marina]|uniref:Nuclear transport factor 2 family protein n=1 Tax=Neptunicella marina TaxID=2125989 RepID=A0A8J6IRX8_9ALTE|nr:hypothetical protein [Neptunicella marina]MBC3765164.1 hypothetical protein [Neptunicella marina]